MTAQKRGDEDEEDMIIGDFIETSDVVNQIQNRQNGNDRIGKKIGTRANHQAASKKRPFGQFQKE